MILSQAESFYTTPLLFEVKVDGFACGVFPLPDGTTFTLGNPTLLAPLLNKKNGTNHTADLESVSVAALRFLRAGGVRALEPVEYASLLFLTRYQWGLAFELGKNGSLKHSALNTAALHAEATKTHTEQFAYGLAVHFLATLLGIPIDRFYFITGSGARPDFNARVSMRELRENGICALSAAGHVVQLEVKARTGWASSRATGPQGLALLHNLSKKSAAGPGNAFLSVIVSLPSREQSQRGQSRTRLILVDPGEPQVLAESAQLILLLEESVPLLIKHGLWPTLSSALNWLRTLRGALTHGEETLIDFMGRRNGQLQYKLVELQRDGRTFNGRIFSDVSLRLGRPNERAMTPGEAESRLALGEFGSTWFSGADVSWINIIQSQDAAALLRYGVRGESPIDLSAKSAFMMDEEPMTADIRGAIRRELSLALKHW
jgi:hypothetical protein